MDALRRVLPRPKTTADQLTEVIRRAQCLEKAIDAMKHIATCPTAPSDTTEYNRCPCENCVADWAIWESTMYDVDHSDPIVIEWDLYARSA